MRVPEFLGQSDRYKIEREIARGGMGVVYRAFDKNTSQWMAVKIMLDGSNSDAQALFDKEWRILTELQHPNIIGITDRGEFWDGDTKYPYFVMPFLRGKTLQECLSKDSEPLTVARVVSIVTAAAESLQAAHSRGVIHRDVKPSNIFVLEAGPVVVIDFGVVHLTDNRAGTTVKGTTPYMAPELLVPKKHEKPSAASDLFSLGVVCYEALTGRQPFARPTTSETIEAILQEIPTPAYEMNQRVSLVLSQVVQKAMAKDRTHRYTNVKEFADKLERAFRSEPLPEFDRGAIEDRLRVVREALAKGQMTSAHLLLRGIEEDGLVDPAITSHRQKIDQALMQKQIREQIESARLFRESKQYVAANEKLNEALALAPDNVDALTEKESLDQQMLRNCLNEARLLMQSHRFDDARRCIDEARSIRERDTQTTELMGELARLEEADRLLGEKKAALYQEAQNASRDGRLGAALQRMEEIMGLIRQASPTSNSERDPIYKNFYEVLLSEHNRIEKADQEARSHLANGKFAQAIAVCDQMLAMSPGLARFEVLKLEAESREREMRLDYMNKVRTAVADVPDLETRVTMLQEAIDRYPNESQLVELLKTTRSRRDLVNGLITRARRAESSGDYAESLGHWQTVKECHPLHPSLESEMQRLSLLRDEGVRNDEKAQLVRGIRKLLRDGDYERAGDQCQAGLEHIPGDVQLLGLQAEIRDKVMRAPQVQQLLARGRTLFSDGQTDAALETLRRAAALDSENQQVGQLLGVVLFDKAKSVFNADWRAADRLLREAKNLVPDHPEIRSLAAQIAELEKNQEVERVIAAAQKLSDTGNYKSAAVTLEEALRAYHGERRLTAELDKLRQHLAKRPEAVETFSPGRVYPSSAVLNSALEPGTRPDLLSSSILPDPDSGDSIVRPFENNIADDGESAPSTSSRKTVFAVVGVLAVVLLGFAFQALRARRSLDAPVTMAAVDITAIPDEAQIFVDSKLVGASSFHSEFIPGSQHEIEVSLRGYQPWKQSLTIGEAQTIPVTLQPIPMELRVLTGQPNTEVWLDEQPREGFTDGGIIGGITGGRHTLRIKTSTVQDHTTAFEFQPGEAPLPMLTPGPPSVLFVGSFDGKARSECNCKAQLSVNDSSQPLEPGSAAELSLPEGDHAAELNGLDGRKPLTISMGPAPSATIAVFWPARRVQTPAAIPDLIEKARLSIVGNQCDAAEGIINVILEREPQNLDVQSLQSRIVRKRNLEECK